MTGAQAASMVLLERADFYIDDQALIEQSLDENGFAFREEKFAMKKVAKRSYYPLFNTTERGQKVREMYESGIRRLHKAGKLRPIYKKWGYSYPDFHAF